MSKKDLIFYTRKHCPICERGQAILDILSEKYNLSYEIIDIYADDRLLEQYQLMIPVIELDGRIIDYGSISISKVDRIIKESLQKRLFAKKT